MEKFKENLKAYYNTEASDRNRRGKDEWKLKIRRDFFVLVKSENKETLLELGPGPGSDSQFFAEGGLAVTAVDLSREMVKICREKGISAFEMDFYDLSPIGRKFECVYAINTLLHVPKSDLPLVLCEISSVLNVGGLFYMGVYGGGDTEHEYVKGDVCDSPRFFAMYSREFLTFELQKFFNIISFETINVNSDEIFHSITMRKKETSHGDFI